MKPELIIYRNTSRHRLLRARDTLLLCSCWLMWGGLLMAFFNGGEWSGLALSLKQWLIAQEVFFRSLTASLHVSMTYFVLLASLIATFLLWSSLNLALARQRRSVHYAPLTPEELARHFALDLTLIDAMQNEKQVLVFHGLCGAVVDLRRGQSLVQPQLIAA